MTVNVETPITAANYNTLQNRVKRLLGLATDQQGYGQELNSSPVSPDTIVYASDMNLLLEDINRVSIHQTGSVSILNPVGTGNLVKADGDTVDDQDGFNQYISVVDQLEDNPLLVDGTQVTLETLASNSRFTPWNGQVTHSFTLTFSDSTHRKAFFNAGGEIHITAQIESTTNAKGTDWKQMLNNMGTVYFKANTSQRSPDSSGGTIFPDGTPFGNFQLTSDLQFLFQRQGQDAAYAENRYNIFAKEVSNSAIQFTIQFQDQDLGDPNVDEQVDGTLVSIVQMLRPTGSFVSVPAPSYSVQASLELGE